MRFPRRGFQSTSFAAAGRPTPRGWGSTRSPKTEWVSQFGGFGFKPGADDQSRWPCAIGAMTEAAYNPDLSSSIAACFSHNCATSRMTAT